MDLKISVCNEKRVDFLIVLVLLWTQLAFRFSYDIWLAGGGNSDFIVQEDTVFVSGMNPDLNEEDIAQHFGAIGVIKVILVLMKLECLCSIGIWKCIFYADCTLFLGQFCIRVQFWWSAISMQIPIPGLMDHIKLVYCFCNILILLCVLVWFE